MTRPTAIVPAMPEYTWAAREHHIEGMVVVQCTLPIDGRPTNCRILRSLPYLDQAVLDAVAASRYAPATFLGVRSKPSTSFLFASSPAEVGFGLDGGRLPRQ